MNVSLPKMALVAGTGRSGTSWLGKILDSSSLTFYKSEPDNRNRYSWFRNIPSRLEPHQRFDSFREPFVRAIWQAFWAYSPNLNERPDFPKRFVRKRALGTLRFGMRVARKIAGGRVLTVTLPRWMLRRGEESPVLVIKSVVSNLRLTWIRKHFPGIKTVLIVRHPGGYLNSIFKGAHDEGWMGVGKKSRLCETVLPFPWPEQDKYGSAFENGSDLERELIYWIVANETPVGELADWPNLKVVTYESLCCNPMGVAAEIFRFLGLPLEQSTEQFVSESTRRDRPGYHAVYKDPIRAAGKWREELSSQDRAVVDAYLEGCSLARLWE